MIGEVGFCSVELLVNGVVLNHKDNLNESNKYFVVIFFIDL